MSKVDDLDASMLLAAAAATERESRMVELQRLELAVQWCVLHPATADTGVATHDPDTTLPGVLGLDESLGGEGTPAVAAITPEPFAAAMGMSPAGGTQLLADALDLTHRLPLLWRRVQDLAIPAWQARRVAQHNYTLSLAAVRWVDARLADHTGCGPITVDRLVAEAIARFDPDEHARREDQGKASWGVELVHPGPTDFAGTSELHARGDTLDLAKFYDLSLRLGTSLPRRVGASCTFGGGYYQPLVLTAAGRLRALLTSPSRRLLPPLRSLRQQAPTRLCCVLGEPRSGHLIAKIREWVGNAQVTIQPVLDLRRGDAVDQHDLPAWMREIVILRDQHCVFPGCRIDARSCDQDHIDPYLDPGDGGPPGQTNPANLACLCRRHHRAKTAGVWRYQRAPNVTGYLWHSPYGAAYLVTPTDTITLPT
jgi:hypothetical protein